MSIDNFPFKIGDVVSLKSGGPEMTVCDILPYGSATFGEAGKSIKAKCIFFFDEKCFEEYFLPETLCAATRQIKYNR